MSYSTWQPDMVIGIDFGMTCTGVAWSGKLSHELRNKVDTSVAYNITNGNLTAWGFLCDPDDKSLEYNELFKLYLDPNYRRAAKEDAPTLTEARRWFQDYLSCLHDCITQYFTQSLARFEHKRVEYVFNVPTTWKDPATIAGTEDIIRTAGFGAASTKDRALVYLTEAEAAAVYTSKQVLEVGDVFLVCDIGGGTTDLNVLKVRSAHSGNVELDPLSWAEGMAVGSTLINFKVQQLLKERLGHLRIMFHGNDGLDGIAARMTQHDYLRFKCAFGGNTPVAGIEDSELVLNADDIQSIFDQQVRALFGLIDQQLHIVHSKHVSERITYIVLSGGLSSSPYVQQRIRDRYEHAAESKFDNARNMKVLVAPEPQLAVVHGLVLARAQTRKSGTEFLAKRCSPVSYRIVCREAYDPLRHKGQNIVKDGFDKRRWATDQVTWIGKKGEVFDISQGASQMYQMKLGVGEEQLPWKMRVAMPTKPPDALPRSIGEPGVKVACEVEFALNTKDFKIKNRHWYQLKAPYLTGEFEVRLILGTGLRFEVWSKKNLLSRGHDEIHVDWIAATGQETTIGPKDGSRVYRVDGDS